MINHMSTVYFQPSLPTADLCFKHATKYIKATNHYHANWLTTYSTLFATQNAHTHITYLTLPHSYFPLTDWPWKWKHYDPLMCWDLITQQFNMTSHKTWIFSYVSVRTSKHAPCIIRNVNLRLQNKITVFKQTCMYYMAWQKVNMITVRSANLTHQWTSLQDYQNRSALNPY